MRCLTYFLSEKPSAITQADFGLSMDVNCWIFDGSFSSVQAALCEPYIGHDPTDILQGMPGKMSSLRCFTSLSNHEGLHSFIEQLNENLTERTNSMLLIPSARSKWEHLSDSFSFLLLLLAPWKPAASRMRHYIGLWSCSALPKAKWHMSDLYSACICRWRVKMSMCVNLTDLHLDCVSM